MIKLVLNAQKEDELVGRSVPALDNNKDGYCHHDINQWLVKPWVKHFFPSPSWCVESGCDEWGVDPTEKLKTLLAYWLNDLHLTVCQLASVPCFIFILTLPVTIIYKIKFIFVQYTSKLTKSSEKQLPFSYISIWLENLSASRGVTPCRL